MRKPHVFLLLALVMSIAAAAAWAAAPKKPAAPAAPAAPHEMRVTVTDDGDGAVMADDDEDSATGGDMDGRKVIVRRVVRGGGMGAGECRMGGGGMGAGGCGMDCGMGRGMRGGMRGHMGMGAGMGGGMGRGHGMGAGDDAMGPGGPVGHFAMLMHHLDLTDAQKEKMRDIHERVARRDVQARADLEIGRMDLHKLMSAERPDGGAINAQIDKVARLRTEQAKSHVAALLEARALLTAEQQKKLHELQSNMGPGGPGMGMGRGGEGMGPMHGMQGMGGMHGMPGMGDGMQKHMRVRVQRDTVEHGAQ